MFQLIYTSTAARSFDEDSLRDLVEQARQKNDRLGVTGVLVYRNGSFLHVLEGEEEETVRGLYDTIRQDERHRWVTLLKASSFDERDFPNAPLAFRDRSVAGARQVPPAARTESGGAHETLFQFQRAGQQQRGAARHAGAEHAGAEHAGAEEELPEPSRGNAS